MFELVLFAELVADGDKVGAFTFCIEVEAGLEDEAVGLEVELLVAEFFDDVEHGAGVE